MLRVISNIDCNILYSLNYHRNRLFLYFLENYQLSIISLLFWVSIPNPGHSQGQVYATDVEQNRKKIENSGNINGDRKDSGAVTACKL